MRCKHCGWPNRPEEVVCSKCGSSLQNSQEIPPQVETRSNQTVIEESVFGENAAPSNSCPKCGYPLRHGMTQCPNCNFNFGNNGNVSKVESNSLRPIRRPTVVGSSNFRGTVNVWTDGEIGLPPTFSLSPIKRNGERKELSDVEFEGENIILNRDNVDPGNLSITSREQAVIYKKDDKWFLEDKSDQKTTFLQVSRAQELHDGDIILMGNRLFVFHE